MALLSGVTKETTCVEESIAGSGTRAEPLEAAAQTPKAAKLRCAFSHSAERIVDELGLLYPENRGNLRKNMASV